MLDFYARSYIEELSWTMREFDRSILGAVVEVLLEARASGRQILLVGNGGSAATASHMACDLGKGTIDPNDPDARRFRVLSLADNNALLTAIGNDVSFDDIFVQQLRMVMREGDVVVLISASGNSPNLLRAAEFARAHGAVTVGLLGFGGGRLKNLVNYPLVVSSCNYGVAEDFHLSIQHIYTQYLRRALSGPARRVAFLDRDGVINHPAAPHKYIERWDQFTLLDGAVAMLDDLRSQQFELVVVTNQQGVGKGVMTHGDLKSLHESMEATLRAHGVVLAGVFACTHLADDGCFCRKPRPGLFHRAINQLDFLVDMASSIAVGDSASDMIAAQAAGVGTRVLIGGEPGDASTHRVRDVSEVAAVVKGVRALSASH